LENKNRILKIISLIIIGFLGNFFSIPLFFGVDLIFGSIATILAIYFFGTGLGVLTAAIISTYTYILWNQPYAIIIFIFEALVVGFLHHKKKKEIVLSTILFWCFIGMPLVWIFYNKILNMDMIATLSIMFKQSINGIFNAIIANLIIIYIYYKGKSGTVPIRNLIFNFLAILVLIPTLIMIRAETTSKIYDIEKTIQDEIESNSMVVSNMMTYWHNQHLLPLTSLAKKIETENIDTREIQKNLVMIKESFPYFHNLYVANGEGITISFYPLINKKGESNIGLDFSDRQYYKDLVTSKEPVTSEVFMGRGGIFSPIVSLSVPIIKDNKFQGYVLGAMNLDFLPKMIKSHLDNEFIEITLIDNQKQIIASTNPYLGPLQIFNKFNYGKKHLNSNGVYFWKPDDENLPEMTRWRESFFFKEIPLNNIMPWTMVVEGSLAPFQDSLYGLCIKILSIAFVVIIIALLFSYLITWWITSPINNLIQLTKDLPLKIEDQKSIIWPNSGILEMQSLISNFQTMSDRLSQTLLRVYDQSKQLRHLVRHDNLTGLPNIIGFKERIEEEIIKAKNNQEVFAVLFLDLDRFKTINDILGHRSGDYLLKMVSERLKKILRDRDFVSRQGGDEFIILLSDVKNTEIASHIAKRIVNEIAKPFIIKEQEIFITVSIGISLYPYNGQDMETLIKNSDIAMNNVKKREKNNYLFYNEDMSNSLFRTRVVESELRRALTNEEFMLYYQPIIDIKTGNIKGVEALIRWKHPELGIVSPLEFIPIAEETGLIIPIGEWVINTACKQLKAWQSVLRPSLNISINISWIQLISSNFVKSIEKVLIENQIEPNTIVLEITESLFAENIKDVMITFAELKKLGVKVALDDFGTGYSSLNYLKKVPIDIIKIDKSFIDDITSSEYDKWIVESIINITHALNLVVVAEGVETIEQHDFLKSIDCDEIQGYLFNPPLQAEEFNKYYIDKTKG